MATKFHIVLCSYKPQMDFFRQQVESIQAQTFANFTCEIRDDGSSDKQIEVMRNIIRNDDRFSLVRNPFNFNVYHNFEAGLIDAPFDADFIAFSDQDDIWIPEKLELLLKGFEKPETVLVHSDLEVIDAEGNQLHDSTFAAEDRCLDDLSAPQLIIRNALTGCTIALRSSLLDKLLPFPLQSESVDFHHDLWCGLVASQYGEIKTLREPLVRYRQHGANFVGLEAAEPSKKASRPPLELRKRSWRNNWLLRHRLAEAVLSRCAETSLKSGQVRELKSWLRCSPFSFKLAIRTFRLYRKGVPASDPAVQTLLGKAYDFAIRLYLRVRPLRPRHVVSGFLKWLLSVRRKLVRSIPFKRGTSEPEVPGISSLARMNASYLPPLSLDIKARRPAVHILVPSAKCEHIFGGLATVFKFMAVLANRGLLVRVTSIDIPMTVRDKEEALAFFIERCGLNENAKRRVSLGSTNGDSALCHPNDIFVTTIWWSAMRLHITRDHVPLVMSDFYYFIQDFEPGFYAWSDEFALADETYRMNCHPMVNSCYLADFLRSEVGLEVPQSRIIMPEIDKSIFYPPTAEAMASENKHRIFVYGRPETPRNLFGVAVAGLRNFIKEAGLDSTNLEVISAGEPHPDIDLGNGVALHSVGKLGLEEYSRTLRSCDMGLSLMLSPHPSYPPFEMALSGISVVTNRFRLKEIDFSPNFIVVDPSPKKVGGGLLKAYWRSSRHEERLAGATFDYSNLGRQLKDVAEDVADEIGARLNVFETEPVVARSAFVNHGGEKALAFRHAHAPISDFTGRKVALLSHFDVQNEIDPYVEHYITSLKAVGFDTLLVSSCMELTDAALEKAEAICAGVILRENRGYDFAGWALATNIEPSLWQAERLLLTNDSIYAPILPLAPLFEKMDATECDFWALSESQQVRPHFQSFFLNLNRNALNSDAMREFFSAIRPLGDKNAVISRYELNFSGWLERSGLASKVIVPFKRLDMDTCNPTLNAWRNLVTEHGFPCLKVQLLRDNDLEIDISDWQQVVREAGYDDQLIINHLRRIKPAAKALDFISEAIP